jgi:hypothetical protein
MRKQAINKRIQKYCISHFQKLNPNDFVIGDAPLNSRCHLNSVQKVKEGKAVKVFSCYTFDRSSNMQCIHFINQLENGKYQDNTWGWLYEWCDYYIIREVAPDEYSHIWDALENTRESIVKINSSHFERLIFRIKPENCI